MKLGLAAAILIAILWWLRHASDQFPGPVWPICDKVWFEDDDGVQPADPRLLSFWEDRDR